MPATKQLEKTASVQQAEQMREASRLAPLEIDASRSDSGLTAAATQQVRSSATKRLQKIHHFVLIVSAVERFDAMVKRALVGYFGTETAKSGAMARRVLLERYYDLVVINGPLTDESGEELALDIMETTNAFVIVVTPMESYDDMYERLTSQGVVVMAKPLHRQSLSVQLRFLMSIGDRVQMLRQKAERAEEKLRELRIVSKAKVLLVEHEGMTENEAHHYIEKQAMDSGRSRKRIAEKILEQWED